MTNKISISKPFDKLKETKMYESTDGKKFTDTTVATNYQTQLDIANILGFQFSGDTQTMNNVTVRILQNKDVLIEYLSNL